MSMRRCPRCPRLIPAGTRYCSHCARRVDQDRGSRQARGYDAAHEARRAADQRRMDAGERFTCWRCTKPIDPRAPWDEGHCDDDKTVHHGPEHIGCNRPTHGRTGPCPHPCHGPASPSKPERRL